MLRRIQKSRAVKVVAIYLAINLLFSPNMVFALTGGPSQPEVQSFSPIGTSEMVDPFTGDFNYNIPLIDVGGYPINLIYNSGIGMDQEASWTGLGWNVNPGVINRNMRGIPDDFKGEAVTKEFNMKPNQTYKASGGIGGEIFGIDPEVAGVTLSIGMGVTYNNYTGIGIEHTANLGVSIGESGKSPLTAGLGVSSSQDGLTLSPSLSFSQRINKTASEDVNLSIKVGTSFNSRAGLSALTVSADATKKTHNMGRNEKGEDVRTDVKKSESASAGSSTISFGTPTYVPSITMPMSNFSASFAANIGGTLFGGDIVVTFTGGYSEQRLAAKSQAIPSYGYLYAEDGQYQDRVVMDFNREKDGAFNKATPSLPLANSTYDIFSVSGQGVGGTYRPFRGDVGYIFDSKSTTTSGSFSLGIEVAVGNTAHSGADVNVTDVNSTSGKWTDGNFSLYGLGYRGKSGLYEPSYYKQVGEKSVESDAYFNNYGDFEAVRAELINAGGLEVLATNRIKKGYSSSYNSLPADNRKSSRVKRNQLMSFLTKDQVAAGYGVQGTQFIIPTGAKPHHIGEISILKEDGSRYVYGLPLYNTKQKEVTFNAKGRPADNSTGLVTYGAGDNSTGNERGIDNYYSSSEIQPYAHSYLLTAVLSVDYVDLTGNGPSDDDLGDYKLFNYSVEFPYNWRVPVGLNKANYSEGLKSIDEDDKGNYIYGEKKLRYLENITTKNYIAIFDSGIRDDAKGVSSDNGLVVASSFMKVLNKISLFAKPDYVENGADATPIKEVHFTYDYSLCPGVPNNLSGVSGTGKLTLKEVYFTYGKSKKGKLSPYKFRYADKDHDGIVTQAESDLLNPSYNLKGYDRWGNYKPNAGSINTAEFPYVDQDGTADNRASAWNLTDIELPSGGEISIDYESDDYAYVQNKRAMQMFKINALSGAELMEGSTSIQYFNLPSRSTPYTDSDIGDLISGVNKLYFRYLVDVTLSGNFEYISGYANISHTPSSYGVISSGTGQVGFISFLGVGLDSDGSGSTNPISKAAWQFGRLNTPRLVWDQPAFGDGGASQVEYVVMTLANPLSSIVKNIIEAMEGPNGALNNKGYGKRFIPEKSWIRLNNPDKKKEGGGVRVAKIEIKDNWGDMTSFGTGNFSYGQVYDYTMMENGKSISSGVAAYEPILGGDENPWKQPVAYSETHMLASDDEHYMETPFGESFFPAPTVGYRRVTVKNLPRPNVNRNATGKVVHEFYTAYDFPTKVRQTDLDRKPKKTNPIIKLFTFKSKDYMTASQGFAIELNDMHGKPKAQWVYAENQPEAISGVEYKYAAGGNTLNNYVKTIQKNGTVATNLVGVEYELVGDMREQKTSITNVGANDNLASFLAIFFPAIVPIILPSYNSEETRFRSSTMTKVINRYGILQETVAHDLGSKVSTKNLAYDAETGEVLVTETINNFEDPMYSLKYPAHWAYDRMGQAYKNIGYSMNVNLNSTIANPQNFFVEGDEVSVSGVKGWITKVVPGNNGTITVLKRNGDSFSGNKTLTVLRSGRRNLQSVSIGSLTTKSNPLTNFSVNIFENVVHADVVEFSDDWRTFCECMPTNEEGDMTTNPYILGTKGNWRPKRSLLFLTDRIQTRENDNTNIRKDGTYKNYNPYWKLTSNKLMWLADETNWTWSTEITEYSPQGFELENKDALGRYSAAVYGYNNSLPTAVASNAKYKETAFDGFEDYDFGTCDDNHFSYRAQYETNPTIMSEEESHSGRRSIKLEYGQYVEVTKYIDECP